MDKPTGFVSISGGGVNFGLHPNLVHLHKQFLNFIQ